MPRLVRSGTARLALLSLLGGLVLMAQIIPVPVDLEGDSTCKTIALDGNNAVDVAKLLDKLTPSMTVRPLNPSTIIACASHADEKLMQVIGEAALKATKTTSTAVHMPEQHSVQLFYLRSAKEVAAAFSGAYPTVKMSPVGDDLIVFNTSSPDDEDSIHEIKRSIALIDMPRPEVSLLAWSAQVSAGTPERVVLATQATREMALDFNARLQQAIGRGWAHLNSQATNVSSLFSSYLMLNRVSLPGLSGAAPSLTPDEAQQTCLPHRYCLGYETSIEPLRVSIGGMLLKVITDSQPAARSLEFVNRMENRPAGDSGNYDSGPVSADSIRILNDFPIDNCDRRDATFFAQRQIPAFACLREQLTASFGDGAALALFRRSVADFLFQYKIAVQYPHDFDAFKRTASAQDLNIHLDPILLAFNRDLAVYLALLQQEIRRMTDRLKADFISTGIVTVRAISGIQATATATSKSALRDTPPPLAQDFVRNNTNSPIAVSPDSPGTRAVESLLASSQPTSTLIGRFLNFTVTANSLQGASAAELTVQVNAGEEPGVQKILADDTRRAALFNRVSDHSVSTQVRVDALKLFEISSFSGEVRRSRQGVPLLPPFIELPYIGSLARFPMPPSRAYHSSIVMVNALIVPTAAELANTIFFKSDRTVNVVTRPRESEAHVESQANRGQGHEYFYWLVMKDSAGLKSVDGPIVARHDRTPIVLSWKVQHSSVRVDVLRTMSPHLLLASDPPALIASDVTATSASDDFSQQQPYPVSNIPVEFAHATRIADIGPDLVSFHEKMLKCIYDEARGVAATGWCASPDLTK